MDIDKLEVKITKKLLDLPLKNLYVPESFEVFEQLAF
jgi:hypothetical protein